MGLSIVNNDFILPPKQEKMEANPKEIDVRPLFAPLHENLIDLLKSLEKEDWQKPTIARFWNIKQVTAHILDGNIRALSIQRDQYNAEQPPAIDAYQQLVGWLNQLNADWIKAFNRVSPQVLIALLQATGPEVNHYFSSLPLNEKAIFPVAWAGETESLNKLHIAREYTERWLHQQQIRDALERPGIMIRKFFYPFIHTFMQGLPKAYQEVIADTDTHITIEVTGEIGGVWHLLKTTEKWKLVDVPKNTPDAQISIPPDIAWKLFSKGINPVIARREVKIKGKEALGLHALNMVSVMA